MGVANVIDARQQRGAEYLAVARNTAHRHAAEVDPVVAPLAADEAGALPLAAGAVIGQGDLECGVGRL